MYIRPDMFLARVGVYDQQQISLNFKARLGTNWVLLGEENALIGTIMSV